MSFQRENRNAEKEMKPVLPKLQEFGEDGDEQAERVGANTVSSQRAKRSRVRKPIVVAIEIVLLVSQDEPTCYVGYYLLILLYSLAIQSYLTEQPARCGSWKFL